MRKRIIVLPGKDGELKRTARLWVAYRLHSIRDKHEERDKEFEEFVRGITKVKQ